MMRTLSWSRNVALARRQRARQALFAALLLLLGGPVWAAPPYVDGAVVISSSAYEKSHVIRAVPSSVLQWSGYNVSASNRWVMFFNATALPANGTAPVLQQLATATNSFSGYGYPEIYNTGIVVACSTTDGTLTVTVANDCFFHVQVNP